MNVTILLILMTSLARFSTLDYTLHTTYYRQDGISQKSLSVEISIFILCKVVSASLLSQGLS